jgi:hypothetical protein
MIDPALRVAGITCLVTIGGIASQYAPSYGLPGYADGLHSQLRRHLQRLGSNPISEFGRAARLGPVYVQIDWPHEAGRAIEGLKRLGRWREEDAGGQSLDIEGVPLVDAHHAIAHVALVYAEVDERRPTLGSRPRTLIRAEIFANRGEFCEHVQYFVREALIRLSCRSDVGQIVVNAHGEGTIVAYEVLRRLPPVAGAKVKWLVTAGSPLRTLVNRFSWSADAGRLTQVPWANFWDEQDLESDPLIPPADWRRGDPLPLSPGYSRLLHSIDPETGEPMIVKMVDVEVKNATHSSGGVSRVRNYWENDDEFVSSLASILQAVEDHARLLSVKQE